MIEMRNIHCSGNSRFITISGNMVACRATLLEVLEQSEQDTHNHFCFGSLLQVTSEERRAASPALQAPQCSVTPRLAKDGCTGKSIHSGFETGFLVCDKDRCKGHSIHSGLDAVLEAGTASTSTERGRKDKHVCCAAESGRADSAKIQM